jgi:hypothetical protein
MIEIELDLLGVIFGVNHEFPVRARRNRGLRIETDRRRHDKPIVVIGVFPNQIHSPRRLVDPWRFSKKLDESLPQSQSAIFDR